MECVRDVYLGAGKSSVLTPLKYFTFVTSPGALLRTLFLLQSAWQNYTHPSRFNQMLPPFLFWKNRFNMLPCRIPLIQFWGWLASRNSTYHLATLSVACLWSSFVSCTSCNLIIRSRPSIRFRVFVLILFFGGARLLHGHSLCGSLSSVMKSMTTDGHWRGPLIL